MNQEAIEISRQTMLRYSDAEAILRYLDRRVILSLAPAAASAGADLSSVCWQAIAVIGRGK